MRCRYGCLLIHGLGGNPAEMMPLAEILEQDGFMVAVPKLKGHTGDVKHLKDVGYKEWIFAAESALLKLVQQCDKIYIVGLSVGGLIAIELATRYKIGALVFINTPVFNRHVISNIVFGRGRRDAAGTGRYFSAAEPLPMSAIKSFRELLSKVKPAINRIQVPVMVVQSSDDVAARDKSAQYLLAQTASSVKQPANYENAGHALLTGPGGARVAADIKTFFHTLEKIA